MASPIDDKERFIINSEQILTGSVDKLQDQIFNEIRKVINEFDISGGNFVNSDNNIRLIAEVERQIQSAILGATDYPSTVAQYVKRFRSLEDINAVIQQSVNGLDISAINLTNIQRQVIEGTVNELLGQGMNFQLINPVKQQLALNVYTGGNVNLFEDALRAFVKKNTEVIGNIDVGLIATDAIGQYDGTINQIIMNQFELDGWGYVGSIIKTSRPQCRRWVQKEFISNEELPEEIAWADISGSGMIPGTTEDNFGSYRGGYNCRHRATPLRKLAK